jgi:type II secretory pathway pseudopilin PulG
MDASFPIRRTRKAIPPSEQGYVMLFAIFLMALLVLSLAVAAPKIARSIQRDRDVETFHRGLQYRRAIQLYYRKFKAYPPNVDALVKTNEIRFLRNKYKDPITGQDDWKPIMFGQNKTPTAMGFFGQPLSGNASTIAGVGPSGGGGIPGITTPGGLFGPSTGGGNSPGGSIFGSSDTGSGQTPSTGGSGSTNNTGSGGTTDTTGGSSTGGTSTTGTGTGSGTGTGTGLGGQTFGGAGIIGFEPASPKTSILIYKKKQHYNEWEFTYDPLSDMKAMPGGNTGLGGQPASNTTTPFGTPTTTNPPIGGPTPTPTMPPETPAPQQ